MQIALARESFCTNVAGTMEELTCPNCNCDVGAEELKRNNLRCPTCGFDMSDAEEAKDFDEDEELEDDEDEDEEEEDEKE
jgi:PHP family Zn ribbon phosphoesterase